MSLAEVRKGKHWPSRGVLFCGSSLTWKSWHRHGQDGRGIGPHKDQPHFIHILGS